LCVVACAWFDSLKAPAQTREFGGGRDVRSGFAIVLFDLPPNTGHMMMLEQPEIFSDIVCAMIDTDSTADRDEAVKLHRRWEPALGRD